MSSSTPIRNSELTSTLFQKELGTPPKFRLKKPKETWEQIIRKAVTLRPKSSLNFHIHEIYGRVIESYPYFRTENPDIVRQNINEALKNSDHFKSLGNTDNWSLEESSDSTISHGINPKQGLFGADMDQNTFKMPTSFAFSPIRESNVRPLAPNNRQILPAGDPFGPPKLAPLLPSSPTPSSQNTRRTPRKIMEKEHAIKILPCMASSGFSPIRSHSGMADVFMNDRHDSDTEDEDWKSLGPQNLSLKKKIPRFPLEQLVPLTPSKRINSNSDPTHSSLPRTPVTPSNPLGWVKPMEILPNTKEIPQEDDEDTDDENWAQMDLTPKRKPVNSSLESHTPMKKALDDISNVGEQLPNDKRIALEALALLCCSPNRGSIPTDTTRHSDARPTAISL
ncbi:hypothetical protein K7432_002853 [Basidiobolus ranarum]|uniref:Fork-head domain-containing protein n=1 Tax=Basidiobolus ranarum TaxID=34480 RepID=A0ABR2X0Y0_9FUNG